MEQNKFPNIHNEQIPSFSEVLEGNTFRFVCTLGTKEIGSISATLIEENTYTVGGLFIDPSKRGQGISSELLKRLNTFLEKNNSLGRLVNTIKGDAAGVYENNGWQRGEYKSQGAYGGYEYTYDARK